MLRVVVLASCSLIACGDSDGSAATDTDALTSGSSANVTAPSTSSSSADDSSGSTSTGVMTSESTTGDTSSGSGGSETGYDPGVEGDGDHVIGPEYMDAPEINPGPDVPRGDIFYFTMDSADSAIFPGVTGPYIRDVWVYVPQQYEDGTAAPFMVVQDGGGHRDLTTATLDSLIHAEEVPVMIGIFINPGPGDGMGSERGLEYDRVSEDYTDFIETEVLPIIPEVTEIAAAYPELQFSDDPWDRASMGGSSGGAAAMTMGWLRPDLYRRILTYSGTFVAQHSTPEYPHGAWEYHEHLIADEDKKPLRIFLEVGESDFNLDRAFGDGMHDWVAANEAMAAALAAKGYHYRYVYALGAGHVDGNVLRQTLQDTLRWLWRG